MELLAKADITQRFPRLVETSHYIVINSQVYDKYTLNPIPFTFYVQSNTNSVMQLSRMLYTQLNTNAGSYSWNMQSGCEDSDSIVVDSTNQNRYYQVSQQSSYDTLFQVNEEIISNNKINIINQLSLNQTNSSSINASCGNSAWSIYGANSKILYQTDRYLVFLTISTYVTTSGWFNDGGKEFNLRILDKATNTNTIILSYRLRVYDSMCLLALNNANGYVISIYDKNYFIYKIYTPNKTVTTLWTRSDSNCLTICTNYAVIDNNYYTLIDDYTNDDSIIHKYGFIKFNINFITDVVSDYIVPIYTNGFTLDDSSASNWNGITDGVFHHMYSFIKNNKKYIIIVVHSIQNFVYYPEQHKIMVFKLSDDETYATCVSKYKFSVGCKGVMEFIKNDPTVLVTLHPEQYQIFKFNETTEEYDLIFSRSGIYYCIGFDSCGRFYAQDNDYNIETFSVRSAVILKADFSDEIYEKTFENINTNIFYYAKNIFDEYTVCQVKLDLYGNVQFLDGTKSKIIKTTGTGMDTLPVIITGGGKIEVMINQYE